MAQKICIFGASGATGTILVQLALERGFEVAAFVRSQAAKEKLPAGAAGVVGDLLDRNAVESALAGCQAVILTIGPRPASTEAFCANATQNILEAMKAQKITRILCVTGAMVGNYPHLSWFMRSMRNAYQMQQPALAQDRSEQERRVAASGLDWTVVKPPRLANGKARGRVRAGLNFIVGATSSLTRADLSRFLLDQLDSDEFVHKQVVVQS